MNEDLTAFVDALKFTGLFDKGSSVVVARAPGRLDVMGGIADYSGSLVLQRPIAEATFAAIQRTDTPLLNMVSLSPDANGIPRVFALPLSALMTDGAPIAYDYARSKFRTADLHWASYVAGVFLVLMRERGVTFSSGAKILISSRVPEGKGVASSAALEVAVMQAVVSAFGIKVTAQELALLCQRVENHVAGAPCGVMDQMTSVCGEADALLSLVCQPAELQPPVVVPDSLELWGMDSGERHAVTGSDYTSVRTGAFMGFRILTEGVACRADEWSGYLANVSPVEFVRECVSQLPEQMSGAEFLARHSGTADTVTTVNPARTYKVRQPTAHPVFENYRVHEFQRMLTTVSRFSGEAQMVRLGELMYQSHDSYSACGLGSPGTDLIVKLVRAAGPSKGLYGARITGGGSGGTVAILGRADAQRSIDEIAEKYRSASLVGYRPLIFSGSSQGADAFGSRVVTI